MISTMQSMRRMPAVLAALATTALLLSGCASASPDEPAVVSASATQQRDFREIYEQEIDWQVCGEAHGYRDDLESYLIEQGAQVEGLRCAWITAPLDWNDPDNHDTIRLAVSHIPATGEEVIGTLFSNPGGPGASGNEFTFGLTSIESFAAIHEQYDLIGFDPRGMARSSAFKCAAETDIFELLIAMCADENPLAQSMGTTQVARDMELMRVLIEDESMHYAGFSYGTVIGATYATLFPEQVGRMMLDSAWPSDWSSPLGSFHQAEAIAHANADMLIGCATDYEVSFCPLDGELALVQTMAELDAQPLEAADGTQIDGRMLHGYLTSALYQSHAGRQAVLDVVGRALAGEQAAIDELATAMQGGGKNVSIDGMIVRCLSSSRDANLVGLYEYINENGLPVSLGGPEVNDENIRDFFQLKCEGLPNSGEDYLDFSYSGEEPILVYGITGDHATPYEGAQQLVDELGNATLVTLEGVGHIATYQGRSSCADDIATAYLLSGDLPKAGTVCTDD